MLRLIARLIYTGLLIIEALVATRFILKLINANQDNEIVSKVLAYSDYFVKPFQGIVNDTLAIGSLKLDLNSVIALVFYMILAFVAIEMIKAFSNG